MKRIIILLIVFPMFVSGQEKKLFFEPFIIPHINNMTRMSGIPHVGTQERIPGFGSSIGLIAHYPIFKSGDLGIGLGYAQRKFTENIHGLIFSTDIPNHTTSSVNSNIHYSEIEIPILFSYSFKSLIPYVGPELDYQFGNKTTRRILYGTGEVENLSLAELGFNASILLGLDYNIKFNEKQMRLGLIYKFYPKEFNGFIGFSRSSTLLGLKISAILNG